jgi:hypothetical protein
VVLGSNLRIVISLITDWFFELEEMKCEFVFFLNAFSTHYISPANNTFFARHIISYTISYMISYTILNTISYTISYIILDENIY